MNNSTKEFIEKAWSHHVSSKLQRFYSNVCTDFDGFLKAVESKVIDASDEPKFELYIKIAVKAKGAMQELLGSGSDSGVGQGLLDQVKDVVAPLLDLEVIVLMIYYFRRGI